MIVDNLTIHKDKKVMEWLAGKKRSNFTLHQRTPAGSTRDFL